MAAAGFGGTLLVAAPDMPVLALRAVSEAALIGGLADWFAVTALFRRPLGLPIPHTAILPTNKERIGEGLARFLDQYFLAPELLAAELRALNLAGWLSRRRNAQALAGEIVRALPHVLRATDDRQIVAFVRRTLGAQLHNTQLAPLAGQLLRAMTAAGYHEAVLDSALVYAAEFLGQHRDRLIEAVGERRRGWIPRAINREVARGVLRGVAELIEDLRQPGSTARLALMETFEELTTWLESSAEASARLVESPRAVLRRPEVRAWIASSWTRLRDLLLRDLESASSQTQRSLALVIGSVGEALRAEAAMRERLDATLEALVVETLPWRAELARFVTEVVRGWDVRSFSDRIEIAVGADLQFIRMNGTVVGGLVGGALFLISVLAR
ncbi:MAG TPA: DUF445 domain-containing protein [Stellaceae bacterium]